MPFGSNGIEKESAANLILITQLKNEEVFNALEQFDDVCNVKVQPWIHFFVKKTITREHAKQHQTNYCCTVFFMIGTMLSIIKQRFVLCSDQFVCLY